MKETVDTTKLALLSIDDFRLALPRNQVITLEPSADLHDDNLVNGSVGRIKTDSGIFNVYQIDSNLQVSYGQNNKRIIVVLNCSFERYAILVDEFQIMPPDQKVWVNIPDTMKNKNSPLLSILLIDQQLIALTVADELYKRLIAPLKLSETA